MKSRFKTKRKYKISGLFWLILFFITIYFNVISLDKISYDYLLNNKGKLFEFSINKDKLLHKVSFNIDLIEEKLKPVFNEIVIKKPKVYIYNTHQSEEYVDSDVFEMARVLKDLLINRDIDVDIEETNIKEELKSRNYSYNDSYKITRELLSNKVDQYDLYIDFHRDSSKRSVSTASIDGKEYARLMFVVGKNHSNYKVNYDLASNLNKLIKNYNNKITRGIYVKDNSAFNQDLDGDVLLIEVGGVDNTSEEVSNTLNILSEVIEYYLYL